MKSLLIQRISVAEIRVLVIFNQSLKNLIIQNFKINYHRKITFKREIKSKKGGENEHKSIYSPVLKNLKFIRLSMGR